MELGNCVMHSLFSALICLALVMSMYQRHACCFVDNMHSVCMVYGCGDFWSYVFSCCCRDYLDTTMSSRERRVNELWKDLNAQKQANANGKLQTKLLGQNNNVNNQIDDDETTAEMTPIPHVI